MPRLFLSEDGASLIELAVVLPMLALLLIGVIETGRFLAFGVRLGNAAHAGATYGAQSQTYVTDSANIANVACNDSGFSCTTSTPEPGNTASPDTMLVASSVTCSYSNGTSNNSCQMVNGTTRNMFVHVSTSATFKPLLNYPYMSNPVPMSATAVLEATQ